MSFYKFLKISPFVILTLLNAYALSAHAATGQDKEGGVSGGGGDVATEMKIDGMRGEILKWLSEGEAKGLVLPQGVTLDDYVSKMSQKLAPHAVVIGAVSTLQESRATDPEQKVIVNGQFKTCRGFKSVKDGLSHILCNVERFATTPGEKQLPLIHHEYAGLAGLEQNIGGSSDYAITSQLNGYLFAETVWRLSVNKRVQAVPRGGKCPMPAPRIQGAFDLIENPGTGSLAEYLKQNVVSRSALNDKCESLYFTAVRVRNEAARRELDAIKFGPNTPDDVNANYPGEGSGLIHGASIFEASIMYSGFEVYKELERRGGKILDKKLTPFLLAVSKNTQEVIAAHLRAGAKINETDDAGASALIYAAKLRTREIVEFLIQSGADVNLHAKKNGFTPLIAAANSNTKDVVESLIRAGADINATREEDGATALFLAATYNTRDVVEALFQAGADIHLGLKSGVNVLMAAAQHNTTEVVEFLIRVGLDVNATDSIRGTPLMAAAQSNKKDVVETLIRAGANVKAVDFEGETALMAAVTNSAATKDIIEVLIRAGIDVNASKTSEEHEGLTALHYAAMYSSVEVIKFLLQSGASKEKEGRLGPYLKATPWGTAYDMRCREQQSRAIIDSPECREVLALLTFKKAPAKVEPINIDY